MSKVLYIKANPKSDQESRTFKVSEHFINVYKKYRPNDEIIKLELYKEKLQFLTMDEINQIFSQKDENSKNQPIFKYVYQFAEADKYVIAAPMWNLSIPSILKAYIDYIVVSGITFKYTEEGAVGLLQGKKAIHIMATGGEYTKGPFAEYEMANRYLKTIFGFMGIVDFETLIIEKLDILGQDVEGILNDAIKRAEEMARKF